MATIRGTKKADRLNGTKKKDTIKGLAGKDSIKAKHGNDKVNGGSGDDQISFFKDGQEQYPVKMRVLESQRRDVAEIGRLTVPGTNGPVRIDNLATVERGLGPSTLNRSGRQFTVNLNAQLDPAEALPTPSLPLCPWPYRSPADATVGNLDLVPPRFAEDLRTAEPRCSLSE